ncbi:trypsin domain-containing protein [Phthorimaea operculella]|nr:trypsin domain-containing protein [Phthorimaea operculella]
MRVVSVLLISVASVLAGPTRHGGQKIIGGEVTTIDLYPYAAAMIYEFFPQTFGLNCGGAILNEKSILSAAHCYSEKTDPSRWRVRVGSSFASSGGQVHNVVLLINHPDYYQSPYQLVHDVAVIHLQTFITFNALVRQALIAGPNYVLETNDPIQSIGWGMTGVVIINHPDYYQSPYQLVHDVAVIHLQTFITFNALVRQALIAGPNYVLETNDPIQSIGWGMTGKCITSILPVCFASSGGQVHNVVLLINHPDYYQSPYQLVHDVAVIHLQTFITFNALVRQALIAGPNYVLETNDPIQSIGWVMTGSSFNLLMDNVVLLINHPDYYQSPYQLVHDVAVIHLQTFITFNTLVRQALIAGPNYVLETNDPIQSIGWE